MRLEPTTTFLLNEHSTISQNRSNYWTMLWVLFCTVRFTECFYHFTNRFQSESRLHSGLNVKEVLAWNRRNIWSLSDSNRTLIHNLLACKRPFNHLAKLVKWFSCVVRTCLYGVFDCMSQSSTVGFTFKGVKTFSKLLIKVEYAEERKKKGGLSLSKTPLKTAIKHLIESCSFNVENVTKKEAIDIRMGRNPASSSAVFLYCYEEEDMSSLI